MAKYQPPKQPRALQFIDVALLLIAIFVTLWVPILLGLAGADKVSTTIENPTWESLGQNETMAGVWERLGYTVKDAHDIILNRFDYSFSYLQLGLLIIFLVGYFVFLFKASEAEYKEISKEKFEDK